MKPGVEDKSGTYLIPYGTPSSEIEEMPIPSRSTDSRIRTSRSTVKALSLVAALLVSGCGPPSQPDPLSASAVEARTEAMQQMAVALNEVVAIFNGEVLGEASVDECYEGQRNYKVDTGYDHRCSLLMSVLIAIGGDFRTQMLDADEGLTGLGWEARHGQLPGQLVDEYWDLRASESADGKVWLSLLPSPHSVMRGDLRLLFDYGDVADDRGLERIDRGQQSTLWCCGPSFFESKQLIDVDPAAAAASHEHLILVTVEGHYLKR